MQASLDGTVTLTFINGGISKNGKPYLQVSNGREAFFVRIPKDANVDDSTFSDFSEDEEITLRVSIPRVGPNAAIVFQGVAR